MLDLAQRAAGTVIYRPYVFVFLAVYLLIAVSRMGWAKTLAFTVLAWCVAFAAEFSSTRTGVPFGLYHYIDDTRGRELWISNVPFWDSLSFTFLCYLGYSLAVSVHSPLFIELRDFQIADTREIRGSWRVLFTGTMLMALIDVVVDPLAVRGERWFLGRMYYYPDGGLYFGVPISNFIGWAVVGFVTIFFYQRIECLWPAGKLTYGVRHVPFGGILDFGLYFGILLFNIALTFWIGEPLLGTIAILLYIPVVMLLLSHPLNPQRRAGLLDLIAHRRDFPQSPL
jgi:uncharacterized membrane protein